MNSEANKITTVKETLEGSKPAMLTPHASFELHFKGSDICLLVETIFQFTPNDIRSSLSLTNNQKIGFLWTAGVKGLSLCFISYILHSFEHKPSDFRFVGPVCANLATKEKSPAASLGQGLGKKTSWVQWMFKSRTTATNVVVETIFGGHNREGKNKNLDVTVTVQPSRLPPSGVRIFLNKTLLTSAADLENLLQNIQRQCPQIVEETVENKTLILKDNTAANMPPAFESKAVERGQKTILSADIEKAVQEHISYNESWKKTAVEAAMRGDLAAQHNLGSCYDSGFRVKQDYIEAAKWFRKAAAQDDMEAQYKLGVYYHDGKGVEKDFSEAIEWFHKAAEQGDVRAQYQLGLCYDECEGAFKEPVEIYKWLNLASAQGHERASKKLTKMEKMMSEAQINEARRLVQEFKHKHPKTISAAS